MKKTAMKNKHWTMKNALLLLLLFIGFIWNFLFILPNISSEISKAINSNPITDTLEDIYWDGIPSLISILIAFVNVIYATKNIIPKYKLKQIPIPKVLWYFIYVIFSLIALIMHCTTFNYIINCMLAG